MSLWDYVEEALAGNLSRERFERLEACLARRGLSLEALRRTEE